MRECLVIGQPEVGKTWLSFRIAELADVAAPLVVHELPTGERVERKWQTAAVMAQLAKGAWRSTVGVQTIGIGMGKACAFPFLLHDSTGLQQGIVDDRMVRMGMARTLSHLASCSMALHVVDGVTLARGGLPVLDDLIMQCARSRGIPYFLAVNKIDLPEAKAAAAKLCKSCKTIPTFPVSALSGAGIPDVMRMMLRANVVH